MVEDIIRYGKLDSDAFPQTDELREYMADKALEYGFVNVMEVPMTMPEEGLSAREGGTIEFPSEYIDNNALTYLWPELMERKIDTAIEFLAGVYHDHTFGNRQARDQDMFVSRYSRRADRLNDLKYEAVDKVGEGELDHEQAEDIVDKASHLEDDARRSLGLVSQAESYQAYIYMVNEEVRKGNDPVEALAVNMYNPYHFSVDDLESPVFIHADREFPWLNQQGKEALMDEMEGINRVLERKAEEFEI